MVERRSGDYVEGVCSVLRRTQVRIIIYEMDESNLIVVMTGPVLEETLLAWNYLFISLPSSTAIALYSGRRTRRYAL